MDNASKNAGDMIDSLTLQFNRGRQASITNELVDIITGTSFYHAELKFRPLIFIAIRCQCFIDEKIMYRKMHRP